MIQPLPHLYNAMVSAREITEDAAQRDIMQALETLRTNLTPTENEGVLSRLFKKAPEPQRGIYIWGDVGRGKSMLMDLFFNNAPLERKRRVHFHAFMQEVHNRIHALRQSRSGADPVVTLAKQLSQEADLLCFDELQATDVADATLLYRLFQGLFDAGVVIVSTSNRPPANLYTGGIQAERFAKFIELIKERMDVLSLNSRADYRLLQRKSVQRVYYSPLGAGARQFIEETLSSIAPGEKPHTTSLTIKGRKLPITAYGADIALFSFAELCGQPLGAIDYLEICEHYDTVILTDIPALIPEKRNEAKRFVTLVDTIYEAGVRLICTATTAPEGIYSHGDGSFEFQRTVSRLMEMQSTRYLQAEKPVASA